MNLLSIVKSLVTQHKIPTKDIEATILFLTRDDVLTDPKALRRVVNKLNDAMDYEDAPL